MVNMSTQGTNAVRRYHNRKICSGDIFRRRKYLDQLVFFLTVIIEFQNDKTSSDLKGQR